MKCAIMLSAVGNKHQPQSCTKQSRVLVQRRFRFLTRLAGSDFTKKR
nr:MAG TPA: hypothetical protein [Caudoviricetes sp.]